MENQPAGWESYNMAHSSMDSNAPTVYMPQSSSTSLFPSPHPQFGSYTNPTQQQPQFTFTPTNAPSGIRGQTLQQEQIHQGYQPGTITRRIFANATESVQQARRRTRRSQPTPVATHSDREERKEYTPRSKTNDDKGNKGLMDLQDDEIKEEMMEVIDELLFKLKQMTEDRDRLVTQLRTAKRKHVIPVEEKELPPLKRVDRGPQTMGMFQITPTSSMGMGQGSQLSISVCKGTLQCPSVSLPPASASFPQLPLVIRLRHLLRGILN